MNTQNDLRLDFCKILCQLRRGANEQQQSSIRLIYENTISLFKDSLNIPTVMPTSLEIYSFFNFLKEMQKSHKTVALKSFFIKTKVFLIWLISVYEFFIQQSLEKFKNEDWEILASFLNIDLLKLKFKVFSYLKPHFQLRLWTSEQDLMLRQTIGKLYPQLLQKEGLQLKVRWSKVSYEMSKGLVNLSYFKTDKQCKERWFNHLNPFLNKKTWSITEDIRLLQEFIANYKQWAKIARAFPGRTQHQIKNRFFAVITKEFCLSKEKLRDITQKNRLSMASRLTIASLESKSEENSFKKIENLSETPFLEALTEENSSFDEVKQNYSLSSLEMEFNFEDFINFEKEEHIFKEFA